MVSDASLPSESSLRGAIALNNIAVNLLEQRCYRQAQLVLKDAVSILRHCIATTIDSAEDSARFPSCDKKESLSTVELDINGKLHRAHRCLSQPEVYTASSSTSQLPMCILSDDEAGCSVVHCSSPVVAISHPIKILNPDLTVGNQDPTIAIVSYNYAVSFLCHAALAQSSARAKQLRDSALKIFHVATKFLASSSTSSAAAVRRSGRGARSGGWSGVDDLPERGLLVAVLALRAVVHTLRTAGRDTEALKYVPSLRLASQQLLAIGALRQACNGGSSFIATPAA